ncbi:MAG: MBL fold metallo-hydrolase [Anaerolineales bacterium]
MISLPTSQYFTLHQLADGVFAAIAKVGSPAFSNAGLIDTGAHTLVFDTFNSPAPAEDLRRAAEILTGREVDFVIISHAHSDHWLGNQVFVDHASILTTPENQSAMTEWGEYFKELKRNPAEYETQIREIEKHWSEAQHKQLRDHLAWTRVIERHEYEQLRMIRPQLPDQTFDGQLVFHGPDRRVKVYSTGAGHTISDVVLVLPEEAIAFIGDLGFFQTHPYLGSSTPEKWIATLDGFAASEITTFVPGHGPLGTREDLLAVKEYILALQDLVTDVVTRGGSEAEASAQPVPKFSENWAGFGRFERSIRFLYQQSTEG